MKRFRKVLFGCVALPSFARLVVACSEDGSNAFTEDLDASDDVAELPADGDVAADASREASAFPQYDASDEPVVCTVAPCVTRIVAGDSHFCALLADKTVRCWGDDTLGALGAGDADADAGVGPSAVASLVNVTSLSAAGRTTCALLGSGEARCWGDNTKGQLGAAADAALGDNQPHPVPAPVAIPSAARRIDVGHGTACAVLESGAISCWGANATKQLSRADAGAVGAPVPVATGDTVVTRTGSDLRSSYALTEDGRMLSWGGLSGREGSLNPDPDPAVIPSLSNVTSFGAGQDHVCAVANGEVHCWETNGTRPSWEDTLPICTGAAERPRFPVLARLPKSAGGVAQQVALSPTTTCARLTDGTVYCCGDDSLGQLGRSDDGGSSLSFVRAASSVERAVQVATANGTTCVLLASGAVSCWGGNQHGELGQGSRDDDPHATPTLIHF